MFDFSLSPCSKYKAEPLLCHAQEGVRSSTFSLFAYLNSVCLLLYPMVWDVWPKQANVTLFIRQLGHSVLKTVAHPEGF